MTPNVDAHGAPTLEDAESELAKSSIGALQLRAEEAFKNARARHGTGPAMQGLGRDLQKTRRDVRDLLNGFSWDPLGRPQFVPRKVEAALVLLQAEARWNAVEVYHPDGLAELGRTLAARAVNHPPPTPQQIVANCARKGVVITVDGDGAIRATPAGQLTADDKRQISSQKPEIVQMLTLGEIVA